MKPHGKQIDKFCGLCGSRIKLVRCYNGTFNTKTGKETVDTLVFCTNSSCVRQAPNDLTYCTDTAGDK